MFLMVMEFLKSFIGAKGQEAVQSIVSGLASLDPATASRADLEVLERDLDATGRQVAQLRTDLARERSEADAVSSDYDRMYAAAHHLEGQVAAAADPVRKAELETSLAGLLDRLATMKSRLEAELQDVTDVQDLLAQAETLYKEKAAALSEAKRKLEQANREMERAMTEKQQAERRAEQAAQLAGLRQGHATKLNTALNVFNEKAMAARREAESLRMKADSLKPMLAGPTGDANVQAALAATAQRSPTSSLSDRLAALKR
jgi:uncharacterized protein (DUF3084 family)